MAEQKAPTNDISMLISGKGAMDGVSSRRFLLRFYKQIVRSNAYDLQNLSLVQTDTIPLHLGQFTVFN